MNNQKIGKMETFNEKYYAEIATKEEFITLLKVLSEENIKLRKRLNDDSFDYYHVEKKRRENETS